jgi:hypothetical protein
VLAAPPEVAELIADEIAHDGIGLPERIEQDRDSA